MAENTLNILKPAAMESALGDAYTEPAADVRGYIASVRPLPA